MIILTYISGLLTAVLVVLIIASVRVYKKYTLLLESNQHTLNISSIRAAESSERMKDIEDIVRTIREDYVPNGEVSERVSGLLNDIKHLSNSIDKNSKQIERVWKESRDTSTTLNNRIKKLGEDPNFISKY